MSKARIPVTYLLTALILFGSPHHAFSAGRTQSSGISERLDRLQRWLLAVQQHEPGLLDDLLPPIGAWSTPDLTGVLADLEQFRTHLRRASQNPFRPQTLRFEGQDFTKGDLQALLGLTDEEVRTGNVTRVLKRGALFHTDIALNPDELGIRPAGNPQGRMVMRTSDGRAGRLEFGAGHWEFARLLLDAVEPAPAGDSFVRMWYRATIASLIRKRSFAEAVPHLSRALALFPADARFHFYGGSVQEIFAGAAVQSVLQSTTFAQGFAPDVRPARAHLTQAERLFRQSLSLDPGLLETRVHLANVVGLLGRHPEAAADLREVSGAITEPQASYYAAMFLGREEEQLGRTSAARECFERAAMLYPLAQSPQLALAQLAWKDADAMTAFQAIEHLFEVPPREREREDPWWVYEAAHVQDAGELLDAVRAPFLLAR